MRRFVISEKSMAPALMPNDHFLARRLRRPRRGNLVFFPHPGRSDFWLVKRIIGLPHETISIAGGTITVDGRPLADRWSNVPTRPDGVWEVPPGKIFVLSDARDVTRADSRTFGPVPTAPAYVSVLRYRRAPGR